MCIEKAISNLMILFLFQAKTPGVGRSRWRLLEEKEKTIQIRCHSLLAMTESSRPQSGSSIDYQWIEEEENVTQPLTRFISTSRCF